MIESYEIYKKGRLRYEEETRANKTVHVHEIHDMAEKAGFIGKKADFLGKANYSFENFKQDIIKNSETADTLIPDFLPEYYFTFDENAEKAYYFMEDIEPSPKAMKDAKPTFALASEAEEQNRVKELDIFLSLSIDIYQETFNAQKGYGKTLDLNPLNFVYGSTPKKPTAKLYYIDLHPLMVSPTPLSLKNKIFATMEPYRMEEDQEKFFPLTYSKLDILDKLFERHWR